MWYTAVYHFASTAPIDGGTPVTATSYRRPADFASICKDRAAPHSAPVTADTRSYPSYGSKKLLDQFRDKMRTLHYALATEKAYRHWIVEFLRFHRAGGEWRHRPVQIRRETQVAETSGRNGASDLA